ncbi:MAG: FtsW/RodA/SpoVE family cell cycle protein, partial [Bacteroidia bacterium]|nr:FtsW/RodA/SpoVE family cell cycle protein [Bacteroidia bacterium]
MDRRSNIIANIDWLSVALYLSLVILGWMNIYAAVYNEEHQSIFDISQKYGRQLLWIGAGLLCSVIIFIIDSKFYSSFAYVIYAVVILVLLSSLIFGKEIHGAHAWFQIGDFHIQPSEFAKFATSLALARFLCNEYVQLDKITPWRAIGAAIIPVGWIAFFINRIKGALAPVLLILLIPISIILLQNDTGSAIVYVAFFLVLYREKLPGLYLLLGVFITLLFFLTLLANPVKLIAVIIFIAFIMYWLIRKKIIETIAGLGIYLVFTGGIALINYSGHYSFPLHLV